MLKWMLGLGKAWREAGEDDGERVAIVGAAARGSGFLFANRGGDGSSDSSGGAGQADSESLYL